MHSTTGPFEDEEIPYNPFETYTSGKLTAAKRALDHNQFDQLLESARDCDALYDRVMEFTILSLGRLGLRVGELIHLRDDWVDFDEKVVFIPKHQPCDRGEDGGLCGACKQHARQMAETNDELSVDQAKRFYWKAKTAMAARGIPYTFESRFEPAAIRFFDEFDQFPMSRSSVNRRVNTLVEKSGIDAPDLSPHGLRATAAIHHVEAGVDMWALQSVMGWAYPNTARRYILHNERRNRKILEERHGIAGE